jgi:hypothetical protein
MPLICPAWFLKEITSSAHRTCAYVNVFRLGTHLNGAGSGLMMPYSRSLLIVPSAGLAACAPVATGTALAPRAGITQTEAVQTVQTKVRAGDTRARATKALAAVGFACRQLREDEFSRDGPEHTEEWMCWTAADRTNAGYTLAYGNLAVDTQGRVTRVATGSYPVLYRNLRIDEQGRTVVTRD